MTRLRRHLLHCINLNWPHIGKVIFYCVCQCLINPCTSSILVREREWEDGETEACYNSPHPTLFSSFSLSHRPVFIPLVFIPYFSPCLPLAYLLFFLTHPLHFLFFCFLLHMEALIFSRGAPTSLKRWWMALASVSISKLKQFRDKTSSSLSYWFSSDFGFSL